MSAIFDGVDALIDSSLGVLGIGKSPHHKHKKSALMLSSEPYQFDANRLVSAISQRIERNWQAQRDSGLGRTGSDQNWRWLPMPGISAHNPSLEKQIEKAVVNERGDDWVNQVPTASGLMTSDKERHCNIDLVHRVCDGTFELIELKYASDTPVFAAFEILKYGMLYVFSRLHAAELGYTNERELLLAKNATLCVLAPYQYYSEYHVDWLERELSRALSSTYSGTDFRLQFQFEYFSPRAADVDSILESRKRLFS